MLIDRAPDSSWTMIVAQIGKSESICCCHLARMIGKTRIEGGNVFLRTFIRHSAQFCRLPERSPGLGHTFSAPTLSCLDA